jgi:DNA-binding beta-propeller fold protein YncE
MTAYKLAKRLNSVLRFPSQYQRISFVVLVLLLLLAMARSTALSQTPEGAWWQVRSIYTADFGVSHPAGLAFLPDANVFVLQPERVGGTLAELVMITMYEEPAGTLNLSEPITDPLNVAFDSQANRLVVYDPAADEIIEIQAGVSGIPDSSGSAVTRYTANQFGMAHARGMTIDPQSGRLYILNADARHIVRVTPHPVSRFDSEAAGREGRIAQIDLRQLNAVDLRGIAYNPSNQHLYVLDAAQHIVYELAENGQLVAKRDLSELNLREPQGMVIAPSVDRTDDPSIMNLFILDSGQSSPESTTSQGGQIVELSLVAPTALPPGTTLLPATLVTTVDTSIAAWNPSSPDPSGIAYWPLTGRLLVVDSEVEEMPPYWQGVNVFGATTSGTLVSTCTTSTASSVNGAWNNYSNEPTGVAINPNNNFVYVASDSGGGRLHEVNPGPDGTYCTPDDVVTTINFSTDVEDVAYGNNRIFLAGGTDAEVWTWDLGPNGVLGGGDDRLPILTLCPLALPILKRSLTTGTRAHFSSPVPRAVSGIWEK